MNHLTPFAQLTGVESVQPIDPGLDPSSKGVFDDATFVILLGLGLGVALALMLWFFVSKDKKRRSRKVIRSKKSRSRSGEKDAGEWTEERPKRKRKRRRSHRKTNPTLAETGGLPPVRSDNSPEI